MSFNESNDDLIEISSDYSMSLGSYEQMFRSQCLTDCVINCRDGHIKAHKLVLSVWSQYFRDTFVSNSHHCNQSVIFMKDIPFDHMRVLIELMYCGKASVNKLQLNDIRLSAQSLDINDSLLDFIDKRGSSKRKRINMNEDNDNGVRGVNQNNERVLNTSHDMIVDAIDANNACETDVIVIKEELIEEESNAEENGAESEPSNSNSRVKSIENKSHKVQSYEDTNNNNICTKSVVNTDSPQSSTDVCNKASNDSTNGKSKNKNSINKTVEKVNKVRYSTRIQSKERNSIDKSATQSQPTQSNTNAMNASDDQTSRFAQLSYQERQHHMKLQQIRYQALKGTQIKTEPLSDEEKSNDSQSNSEKLLVQLNPKDLLALCDSEESEYDFEGNDSAKKAETSHTTTSGSNLVETKNKKEQPQSQSQYPSTSSSLATRLLINNNSLSNLLQSNVVTEPVILYNLVPSANWNASPMSAPQSIMYFPDSKSAQNKESNSASDPKLVPMWTNFVNTPETGTKAMQQTSKNTKPNTSSHIPETSQHQHKRISTQTQKDNKAVPKTVNSLLVRKKRNSCYQCNKCIKAYSSHQTLIDHIKIVHENSSENYACKICGKIVKWKDSLRGHFKTNHPDKDSTNMIEILK